MHSATSLDGTQTQPDISIFLQIYDISGESVDENYRDWIEINAFNWSEVMASMATAGGGGAGRVAMEDFCFTTVTTKASPEIFLAVATGKQFNYARLPSTNLHNGITVLNLFGA